MKRLAFSLALLAPLACAAQPADWGKPDTVLLSTALGALAVDWGQSRYIVRHHDTQYVDADGGYQIDTVRHERNPVLGQRPSVGRVNAYFALAAASTVGLTLVLPRDYRRAFLGVVTVAEVVVVLRNRSLGVQVAF